MISKDDLILLAAAETGLPKKHVKDVVDSFLLNIALGLNDDDRVILNGFGTFEMKKRAPRTGRNINTGEPVKIPERMLPSFKPADTLLGFLGVKK